jgi:formyltetrahydrofolate deformylase
MKNSGVLLISCPDQKGIVAAVSEFIYKFGGNILHADEHLDSELNLFLMRIEWSLEGFKLNLDQFKEEFSKVSQRFEMEWEIKMADREVRIALFVSKDTHCLVDLLYRYGQGELDCKIALIISNHKEAQRFAKFYKIPFFLVGKDKEKAEKEALKLLRKAKVELIILARYMQILSEEFVKAYPQRIINIHHSFLPAFIGAKPYHQAFERGVKIIGATSHFVSAELDQGPIIEQDVVRVSHRDSVLDLIQKGRDLERVVLARAIKWYLEDRILVYKNKTVVFN